MRNLSIRTKILTIVVVVNLVGAVTMGLYLHQTFSSGLHLTAKDSVAVAKGAWEDMTTHSAKKPGFSEYAQDAKALTDRMKKVTGQECGLLLQKSAGDEKTYAAARAAAGSPDNWSEGETYVLASATDEGLSRKMQFKASADSVPDMGKLVGIENGACAKTCHGSVKGQGDFWGVSWSTDGRSLAHSVVPVLDASGKPIGLVYSIRDLSTQADADRTSMLRTLAIIALGLGFGAVAIVLALNSLVLKRLTGMIHSMEDLGIRVAGGDFGASFTADGSKDEIGEFQEFFAKFVTAVTSMLRTVMSKGA